MDDESIVASGTSSRHGSTDADDPRDPFNWPRRRKWGITALACFVSFVVGLNSTSITSAAGEIARRFNVDDAHFPNTYWTVTAWNGGGAVVGAVVLPMMERFGFRWIYLTVFALFTLFVVPQALAPNFATLIVSRVIAGGCGNVLQNAVEAMASDMFRGTDRDLPLTLYTLALLEGVTLGPVVGGAITSRLNWRWIFYIELIVYGTTFLLVCLVGSETRGSVILSKGRTSNRKLKDKADTGDAKNTAKDVIVDAIVLPSRMFLTEPVVFFFTLWSAFAFGLVFISTQSVGQVYTTLYNWTESQAGLVQAAIGIGELVGFFICLPQNSFYTSSGRGKHERRPEARLYAAIISSFLCLTGGLFWYAWASRPYIHWILPTIGLGFIGAGIMVIVQAVNLYIADSYAKYAGSAIAAVAFGENVFAAFLPLAALAMYTSLGFQWASSLLGFVALALGFWPVVLVAQGERIRGKSRFMQEAAYE